MPRKLKDSVVVITGASSGIGRATAERLARKGATLVVTARGADALDEVVRACEAKGARALAVPADMAEEAQVQEVARTALETFGRIDVWINNAGVTLFGRFEDTLPDDFRRVIETNLFGYIHGARTVLPVFREQGKGILINVGSVAGEVAQPYTAAYSLTKAGIRSLSTSLRQELLLDGGRDIHVCMVLPATIDTPLFQHAANYTGRKVRAMDPVYPPEKVAKTIQALIKSPEPETYVGRAGKVLVRHHKIAPRLTERGFAKMVDKKHLDPERYEGPTPGNLFMPMPGPSRARGGWRKRNRKERSGRMLPKAVALTALAVPVGLLLYRRGGAHARRPPVRAREQDGSATTMARPRDRHGSSRVGGVMPPGT